MSHLLGISWGRRLLAISLLATLASTMCSFALAWEVIERTGNLGWAASAIGISFVGQILFSLPLGSWAERRSHRRATALLLGLALLITCLIAVILTMTAAAAWLWALLALQAALSLLSSTLSSVSGGAAQRYDQARTLQSVASIVNVRQISWYGGLGLGAWVVGLVGVGAVPALASVFLLIAALCALQLPASKASKKREPLRKKLLRVLRLRQIWAITALGSAWNLAAGGLTASLLPLMTYYGVDSTEVGTIYFFGAGGSLLAGVALTYITARSPGIYLGPVFIIWALAVLVFSTTKGAALLVLFAWLAVMLVNTTLAGLLAGIRANTIPPQIMISASQATMIIRMVFFALGGLLAGVIANWWGIELIPIISAVWVALLVVPGFLLGRAVVKGKG